MACAAGLFKGRAPRIEVVNPVGSGDTMVGAFAVAIARGLTPADQLAYAMTWNGEKIVDVSREFLASNGAPKNADVRVRLPQEYDHVVIDV